MIWILVVVVVGLIGVLAELVLSYQKRSNELRLRQEPLRLSIRGHMEATQEAVSGIQEAAAAQVSVYFEVLDAMARRVEELQSQLIAIERTVFGEGYDPAAPKDDLIEEVDLSAGRVDEKETPEDLLLQAREFHRQEVEGHRLSLQRDVEVVRRGLETLETQLRRGTSAARQRRS